VVSATTTTNTSTTSSTGVTTTLTASITPLFSTSKILILASFGEIGTSVQSNGMNLWIYKNGSQLQMVGQNILYLTATLGNLLSSISMQYLDSPATTSSTTYAIYFASAQGSSVVVQRDSTPSSITLMEIAA
jgi:hypothetical protein